MAGKKSRTPKTSKGIHGGGGKVRLTDLEKVLLGGGAYRRMKPLVTHTQASSKTAAPTSAAVSGSE